MHVLYIHSINDEHLRAAIFIISAGMPSGSGEFLFLRESTAAISSSYVKSGISSTLMSSSWYSLVGCMGNRASMTVFAYSSSISELATKSLLRNYLEA